MQTAARRRNELDNRIRDRRARIGGVHQFEAIRGGNVALVVRPRALMSRPVLLNRHTGKPHEHAREKARRNRWRVRFLQSLGLPIPAAIAA